jgi:hypothetical protein
LRKPEATIQRSVVVLLVLFFVVLVWISSAGFRTTGSSRAGCLNDAWSPWFGIIQEHTDAIALARLENRGVANLSAHQTVYGRQSHLNGALLTAFVVGILGIGNDGLKHGRVTFQQNQNVQRASQSRAIALSILVVIFLKPIWLLQLRTFTHRFRGSFGHLHGKGRDRTHQTIVSAL